MGRIDDFKIVEEHWEDSQDFKLKTVELFAGTKSFSTVAKNRGHKTWTTDFNSDFNCDLTGNILNHNIQEKIYEQLKTLEKGDCVWMSPVCTYWSLAAGNTYWTEFRMPRREESITGIKMMMFCRFVADYCEKKKIWFVIENPNGRAVWILDNQYLKRCWYCQYGDLRAKPTNLWTNIPIEFRTCHNGNKDCPHESAPRGSKTGTQGLKGDIERSIVPPQLCKEIMIKIEQLNKEV